MQNSGTLMGIETAIITRKKKNSRIRKLKVSAFLHSKDYVITQTSNDISLIWLPIIN